MDRISSILETTARNVTDYIMEHPVKTIAITSLISLSSAVVYQHVKYYFVRKGLAHIPGPKPHPIYGNLQLFRKKDGCNKPLGAVIRDVLLQLSKEYEDEKLFQIVYWRIPGVYLFRAESVEAILTKKSLIDKHETYNTIGMWLGNSLLISNDKIWRKKRKILTPTFHFEILKDFIPLINEHSSILCDKLASKSDNEDISRMMIYATLDIIMETAMGVKLDSQNNPSVPYVDALRKFGELYMIKSISPHMWFKWIFFFTSTRRAMLREIEIMHSFTRSVISKRKQEIMTEIQTGRERNFNKKKRLALLDLLLEYHLVDKTLSEEEVREEVDTFTFGGHDTTGIALTFALFLIGSHLDVQQKIHDEIDSVFGSDRKRQVTLDDVRRLEYLECVVKESLRMYPSAPVIMRTLAEGVDVAGYHLPKGTDVIIPIYLVHLDPNQFPDPEKFDPDRFSVENSVGRHPFSFIPFSGGPRSCIGQKFALLEEKIILTNILRRFTIESLDPPEFLILSIEVTLKTKSPVRVIFRPRIN